MTAATTAFHCSCGAAYSASGTGAVRAIVGFRRLHLRGRRAERGEAGDPTMRLLGAVTGEVDAGAGGPACGTIVLDDGDPA